MISVDPTTTNDAVILEAVQRAIYEALNTNNELQRRLIDTALGFLGFCGQNEPTVSDIKLGILNMDNGTTMRLYQAAFGRTCPV